MEHRRPRRAAPSIPEEEGVPPYDELILLAHRDDLARPELRRFLSAVEAATAWLAQPPGRGLGGCSRATDPALDDELNRRAWARHAARFAHSPAALDHGRYRRFAAFLGRSRPDRRPAAGRDLRRRPVPGAEPMTAYVAEGVDRIRREAPAGPQRHQPRRHDPLGQRADRGRGLADHVGRTRGGGRSRRHLRRPGRQHRHAHPRLDRGRARRHSRCPHRRPALGARSGRRRCHGLSPRHHAAP